MFMRKNNTLILKGEKGKEIFDYIVNNAPQIPYEKLKSDSEKFKKELCADKVSR